MGATSGIGRALAKVLAEHDHVVGVTGRRTHLLEELQAQLPNSCYARRMDVADTSVAMEAMEDLIEEMGGVDLVVVSAGTGFINDDLSWEQEKETIDVNVSGFAAIANVAYHHFVQRRSGHLVGISSIAAIRGGGQAPAYNASKAFVSNYLEGLRVKAKRSKLPIPVTDIQPGFVDTDLARGERLFWVASPEKAARQIYSAIRKKKKHAYITRRWRLIGESMRIMPDFIFYRGAK